jgi:hypothetical protein
LLIRLIEPTFTCRYIQRIRKKVRNKARVEGSIVEAYLVEEAANFLSLYFRPQVHSIRNPTPRYDDGGSSSIRGCGIELFEHTGRCFVSLGFRDLTSEQCKAAALYILTNISEMDDFFQYDFYLHTL